MSHDAPPSSDGSTGDLRPRVAAPDAPVVSGVAPSDDDLIAMARLQVQQAVTPPSGSAAVGFVGELPPAEAFPNYQLLRELHRGGQGVVYLAVQKSTKRKVAIKVAKEGPFASTRELARFEREVQILGQLDHPNVVSIHDSGHAAGLVYYVMDYVSGKSLDEWEKDSEHDLRGTLALFAKVCDAVNAAHLRGVIHRDLKPGNIRVGHDGEPKVLDFGLAKIAGGSYSDSMDLMTMTGQFVGSPAWASPEQAEGKPGLIDTRTDVYSLGVMLYHSLTGRFPYEVSGGLREVLNNIIAAEPIRPSTLSRRIDDEVETIVLKALEKDRERRYQTAGELGRDLRRYLAGEPIEAKRASDIYFIRKTIVRHKGVVATVGLVLGTIVAGGVVSTIFWQQAERALSRAQALANFSRRMLAPIEPDNARGSDTTLIQAALRESGDAIATELSTHPAAAAEMRDTIGELFFRIGRYEEAAAHLQPAHDWLSVHRPGTVAHADALFHLAQVKAELRGLADLAAAAGMAERAAEIRARRLGPNHPTVAEALDLAGYAHKQMGRLPEAQELYDRAARILGDAEIEAVAEGLTNRADLYRDLGRNDLAIAAVERCIAIRTKLYGAGSAKVAIANQLYASYLERRGLDTGNAEDLRRAEQIFRDSEATLVGKLKLEDGHPYVAATRNKLGTFLDRNGRSQEAEALLRANLAARLARLGPAHPLVAVSRMTLARTLRSQQRFDQAAALLAENIAVLPPDDRYYADTICKQAQLSAAVAKASASAGDQPAALAAASLAATRLRAVMGKADAVVMEASAASTDVAAALVAAGDPQAARALLAEQMAWTGAVLGAGHPELDRLSKAQAEIK